MISLLIGILIIVVVGAICFWAIEKFAPDAKLANLLKLLVVLVCPDRAGAEGEGVSRLYLERS